MQLLEQAAALPLCRFRIASWKPSCRCRYGSLSNQRHPSDICRQLFVLRLLRDSAFIVETSELATGRTKEVARDLAYSQASYRKYRSHHSAY